MQKVNLCRFVVAATTLSLGFGAAAHARVPDDETGSSDRQPSSGLTRTIEVNGYAPASGATSATTHPPSAVPGSSGSSGPSASGPSTPGLEPGPLDSGPLDSGPVPAAAPVHVLDVPVPPNSHVKQPVRPSRARFGAVGISVAEAAIIRRESRGRTTVKNPRSSAFGLGQLIAGNRVRYAKRCGANPSTQNYGAQLCMMRQYIRERYGSAERAWAYHRTHGWY